MKENKQPVNKTEEKPVGAQPPEELSESSEGAPEGKVSLKESEYHKLVKEAAEYKDRYLRLGAEFDNARKRFERDKTEFAKYAGEGLIVEFLNILDDLERSVEAASQKHQNYEAFLKGIEMVMAHIHDMLKRQGVKPIEAVGKKFDPHCHEILMQEPAEAEEGTVLQELQKGYRLGDRVVRTTKVKVAVPSPQSSGENEKND